MTWPKSWPVGTDHCSICYCFQGNVSTYAFELRHYLDTNLRAEICVTAINMGLKTSTFLYTCLWRKTCQMRTLELHYCKERGTCVGCLCMLIPKYAVSSRDECVVLGVMTVKESSTQLYWVGVCVHAIMCVALAARMVLLHISVKILFSVRSRPLTQGSFHVHYFASYFDIACLEIHHIAWKIARTIVWVKRFDCETRHNNTVSSRHYGIRAIFVPGDVKFQDGDAFDLSILGGGEALSSTFTSFFECFTCASLFRNKVHTHRTTVVLWYDGLCDIRVLFMHDASQCAWGITPIRFNNVRLSALSFRPNISGLLRPRVLKPLHYPTRASRNAVSNLGAIEVGLHYAQVPNSFRKWNRIFIFLFSFTVHCIWCIPLFDELSQSLKQLSTYA